MAYRSKEDTLKEAERLGIDVSNDDWPTMQRRVKEALEREKLGMTADRVKRVSPYDSRRNSAGMRPYLGKTVYIAPELRPDANRIIRYMEELGDDVEIEEKHYEAGRVSDSEFSVSRDYTTGTFRVKGKTGRKVVAESSIPKENAQIMFRPGIDWFPVVTFNGRSGYLYKHSRFPNFRQALIASGYYEDYKDQLKEEPNVFYLTGLLCVEPRVAHRIMREIEERVRYIRDRGGSKWQR